LRKQSVFFKALCLIGIAALLGTSVVSAADSAEEKPYWKKSGQKLNRGITNAAIGWVELPNGIRDVGEEHGVGAAATWGILHGVGKAIQRTAVGIFEIVTFPIGMPQNFDPILEPAEILNKDAKSE